MNETPDSVLTTHCPHCDKNLTYQQIRMLVGGLTPEERASLRGSISAGMRKQIGREGGRRLSDLHRCPCGAMTAKRAKARGHRCEAPRKAKKKGTARQK